MAKLLRYVAEDSKGRVRLMAVCRTKHGKKECRRAHAVPPDALWSGEVDSEVLGDLREQFKFLRKTWKLSLRRWRYRLRQLQQLKAAPAFAEFKTKAIEEHLAKEPGFVMEMEPARMVVSA